MKKQYYRFALRLLFQIQDRIDHVIDRVSMRYEGGVHVKHRLMKYHDFFVNRLTPQERVLDLGCGPGAVAYSVASRVGSQVTGIDLSEKNIAIARERFRLPNLTFIHGDALKALPSGVFDVIVFSNVLEHIEHRVIFLKETQEKLKPKRWLIRVPMFSRDWRVPLRQELGLSYFNDPTHFIEYTRETFESELHAAGFEITEFITNWGEIMGRSVPQSNGIQPSMNSYIQNTALSLFRRCQNQGLMERPAFQRLFQSAYFLYKRYWEDAFYPLTQKRPTLFQNGHVLDIGANIGYTAVVFARALSCGFKVFAFEPEAKNVTQLRQIIGRHHLEDQVTVVQAAVGSTSGTTRLWLNPEHPADHRVLTETFASEVGNEAHINDVQLLQIDEFMAKQPNPRVAFIKIDVQGYETAVCEGMSETLAKNPQAAVAVEYYPKGISALGFKPESLLDFFRARGYQPKWLDRKNGRPDATYESIQEKVQGDSYIDLLFVK